MAFSGGGDFSLWARLVAQQFLSFFHVKCVFSAHKKWALVNSLFSACLSSGPSFEDIHPVSLFDRLKKGRLKNDAEA